MVLAYQRHRTDITTAVGRLRDLFFLSSNDQAALVLVLRQSLELLNELQTSAKRYATRSLSATREPGVRRARRVLQTREPRHGPSPFRADFTRDHSRLHSRSVGCFGHATQNVAP
ncbi:hypothetical protein DES52_1311 [Deinococcus yavapaiensis KR-236]|uniref:Uncharacterized protein n=1 Tax=Deinococcus yavapaiensis KR-236 TaxID=694435 RepID=A0A318S1D2_9DEIO|nr:hypothetical protein DES52_1311 [Deinococcus yavapaiensis KR-236]